MLKNMKIRTKLLLMFLLITAISSVGSVFSLTRMGGPRIGGTPGQTAQTVKNLSQNDMQLMSYVNVIVLVVAVAVSVAIALLMSRDIGRRVNVVTDAAGKLSKGELDVAVDDPSKDEIGLMGAALTETAANLKTYISCLSDNLDRMAQGDLRLRQTVEFAGEFVEIDNSMKKIAASLNEMITQIGRASEEVSNGSGQLSDGAQNLAEGAAEQASEMEQLSARLNEISGNIGKNAENATDVNESMLAVNRELDGGSLQMQRMTASMQKISEASGRIGEIIKTIEDIAFQTNILSLNAAVEAARAGEAGKGFSVVADEVRSLAAKSAEAAQNTAGLIQNSIAAVDEGTEIAGETEESFRKVMEGTRLVADKVGHITETSNRQADSVRGITAGVSRISGIIQTNSATAEESAAASRELSGQAEKMRELVGFFRLREEAEA